MSEETTPEETAETVTNVAEFTSVEQFDAYAEELRGTPTIANLTILADVVAAQTEFSNALAAVAAAEAIVTEVAEETVAEVAEEVAAEVEVVEEPAAEIVVDQELIAATVAANAVTTATDQAATGPAPKARKAQLTHVLGHSRSEVTSVAQMEDAFRAALKDSGPTSTLFEFPVWDRAAVGEDNIIKASNTAAHNDRIMGISDAAGNPLEGLKDFRKAGLHRANCGCNDCDGVIQTPDCFVDYPEALRAEFTAIPADRCAWKTEKQQTLAELDQQVYVYCALDADGNETSGIVGADGVAVPIDPEDETTWKNIINISTACNEPGGTYSLEEFPMLFTIDRKTDKCAPEGAVQRTLNRYFAYQARFMEARKKSILRTWGVDNGFYFDTAPSGIGLGHDFSTLLGTAASVIQSQAGVSALEGYKLAVPEGMGAWVECNNPGLLAELSSKHGLAGLVECGGSSPFADPAAYAITPGAAITVDALAEALKTWEFTAFDPTQWAMPVGETVRIGMTDNFRDMDLAAQNKRGIVIYRDETLFPTGCVPSVAFDAELCNIPVEPARSTIAACG